MDIGPGAEARRKVIAMGTAEEIMEESGFHYGAYLSGRLKIPVPAEKKKPTGWITVKALQRTILRTSTWTFPWES